MHTRTSWFAALDARIERDILRLRTRYELSVDELRGLYISDEQVDQLVDASRNEPPTQPAAAQRPASEIRRVHARWGHIAETFSLSPLDEDLLLIALAPELDLKYETLYAYLNNDVTRKRPTGSLAERLVADVADSDEVARALAAAGTLRARRLVRCTHAPGAQAFLSVEYAADPCVSHWLRGLSPGLAIEAEGIEWADRVSLSHFDPEAAARATDILQLLGRSTPHAGSLPLIALTGQPGSGRAETAAAAASASGRPFVKIDLASTNETEADSFEALERTAVALALVPGVVLLDGVEALLDSDGARRCDRARWNRRIADWSASSLVMVRAEEHEQFRAVLGAGRVIEIRCGEEGFDRRKNVWRDAARARGVQLSGADLASLAGAFALTAGQVRSAVATACDMAAMAGAATPDASQIAGSARQASDQSLGRLAMKIDRKDDWADLVVPATTLQRLREFAAAIRHRHLVFGQWGFGERIVHGAGIKALFAGASGTGKTMAAGVIARELGLDLFKVDLSGVVSKYIGETEKNLDRVFRAARCSNAIVFLDEADAILGKRSEVRDAHDRYANIEVAYLLQRLEEHDGVVILATNLRRNIDEAFNRRMQYLIDFPRPEEAERERIWRGMFPPQSPVAPDVDFNFLARQFDLAGGEIRNVALDAAFIAAQERSPIDMRAIVEALSRQLAKQGKTPTGTDFRQYQRLRTIAGGKPDGR